MIEATLYFITFLFGIVIGSFVNVLILRIPRGEEFVKTRSHCMSCGHQLAWYDNIPLVSWLALGGRCRYCREKISAQYPIIEAANGLLTVLIFLVKGFSWDACVLALAVPALLALSVIDFRTYEIPFGFQIWLGALGLINVALNGSEWVSYVTGFFAVSAVLWLIQLISKGRAIGGGDVKLMAVCGLLLGWKGVILAFFLGCILGSVIHLTRMKVSGEGKILAMGPYLSAGVLISALWGEQILRFYLSFFG